MGCGGRDHRLSKASYEREVLDIVRDLEPEADRLFFDIVANPYPRAVCASKTAHFHRVLQEILDRVERLRPPAEVAALQARFLLAAQRSVNAVGEAVSDIRLGRLPCGQPLNRRIYGLPSTDHAEAVLQDFQAQGYFPFLGGD
jgi:hypothetical protein